MNQILTDVLGLLKRKKVVTNAGDANFIPLGIKKAGSLGLSGPNPSEDITLITASDFVTNYIAPKVGPTTNNTVYGLNAFENNINGVNNVAIGSESMKLNQVGSYSTAVGQVSLYNNTAGQNNTALGSFASFENTIGSNNTALGQGAMQDNQNGSNNTAIGRRALWEHQSSIENVAIGFEAGRDMVFGSANTIIGTLAMQTAQFGDSNTVIGHNATNNGWSGCVILGKDASAINPNAFVVGSTSNPLGNFISYTGPAAEYWFVEINGVEKKIMLAP